MSESRRPRARRRPSSAPVSTAPPAGAEQTSGGAQATGEGAWEPPPGLASLDQSWLEQLRSEGGGTEPDIVTELAGIFLGSVPARIAALRSALEAGQGPHAAAAAHAIKGSSATLHADRLASLAERIELHCIRGQLDQGRALFPRLEAEFATVAALLGAPEGHRSRGARG